MVLDHFAGAEAHEKTCLQCFRSGLTQSITGLCNSPQFFFCSLTEIVGTIYYHLIAVVLMRTHNLDYDLEQK